MENYCICSNAQRIETWGVDTIYSIPSGTLTHLWTLAEDKDIRFLQVRHEETGALAAVMQAKFGGSIGVAVGSGVQVRPT